ncbi:hypothetical protein Nmel_012425, partial [Mimus melanotis]
GTTPTFRLGSDRKCAILNSGLVNGFSQTPVPGFVCWTRMYICCPWGCKTYSQEIEIVPQTQLVCPDRLFLLPRCVQPPYFLPKCQLIAQALPVPNNITGKTSDPSVYWAEVIGENKPIISCGLRRSEEYLDVEGLFDRGLM